jgi:hypothetical protein
MRRSFYRGSLWGAAVVLPVSLALFLLDTKGDARNRLVGRAVQFLDEHARL